jgi:two-component system, OmpR family, sensor kinase
MLAYRLASEDRAERVDRELESFERSFVRSIWQKSFGSDKESPQPTTDQVRQIFTEVDPETLPHILRGLFDASATDSVYLVYWDRDGKLLFRSANAPKTLQLPSQVDPDPGKKPLHGNYRELFRRGPRGFSGVVGKDISSDVAALQNLGWQITGFGGGLWLIGLLGGWWLAGRAIQPIDEISRTASRIANGNVSERIDIADTDNELGRLSHVLNDTFDRLEIAIQRQRQFTADASHELRTPLTVILSETSRGLKRDRSTEEYREIISTCAHAATRMRSLVESLLILARQDGEPPQTGQENCDLAIIVSDAIQLLRPLADQKNTRLESKLQPVKCTGDSRSLSMVIVNLISNAIEHQETNGEVLISLTAHENHALLKVTDRGAGIAEEHLPKLFDRFYRVDPARGAAGGHSGLGLAIAKAIVENHYGTIDVESQINKGSTFTVMLPR